MTLAELVIKMSADTASLRTDFDKAGKMAEKAADVIKSAFAGIGAALSAEGLGEIVKSVSDFGEEISRAAQKTGMAAEQISGLKFAAESTGTEFDVLVRGLAIFDRNVSGLANTNSQAAKAIAALGISTKDAAGHILPAHALLLDIAQRFQGMRDGAEKTAIAMTLFGRSGADLIPLLDRGAAGISELEARAKDLGVTLSGQDTQAAVQLKESLYDVSAAMTGLRNSFVLTFSPAIVAGIEGFTHPLETLRQDVILLGEGFAKLDLAGLQLEQRTPLAKLLVKPDDVRLVQEIIRQFDQMQTTFAARQQSGGPPMPRLTGRDFDIPLLGGKGKDKKNPLDFDQYGPDPEEEGRDQMEAYYKSLIQFTHGLMMAQNPLAQYAAEMSKLNDALKIGLVSQKEYADLSTYLGNQALGTKLAVLPMSSAGLDRTAAPQFKAMTDSFATLRGQAKQFGTEMSQSFTQMIVYGRGFTSMLQSMIDLLAEFILKTYVFNEISSALSSAGGGSSGGGGGILGVLGAFIGGLAGRAAGGPVTAGSMYMVGETGPELFAPGVSGSIIPSSGFGGGGNSGGDMYVDARGAYPGAEQMIARAVAQIQRQTPAQALAATYEYKARGGNL